MADVKGEPISITVKNQEGAEVQFKIKKTTLMSKVFKAYCDKKGLDVEQIRFLYDGLRVGGDVTAEAVGLEDGDAIDAVIQQIGGC